VARHPASAARTALVVLGLPRVRFDLTTTPAGQVIRRNLGGRTCGLPTGRLGRAVLALPSAEGPYLQGRRRQALRTNARHARNAGVSCDAVRSLEASVRAARAVYGARCADGPDALAWLKATLSVAQGFVASAADGRPIAFAGIVVDGETAYLDLFISSDHADAGWARYLLQVYVAVELGQAGVRHLVSDSMLMASTGVSHFQHLVGFGPANVTIRTRPSHAAGARLTPR
jgi:hypothetical protein